MSRKTLVTLLLIIATALLAVALFIAGAIWRGRVTARSAASDSGKLICGHQARCVNAKTVSRRARLRVEPVSLP